MVTGACVLVVSTVDGVVCKDKILGRHIDQWGLAFDPLFPSHLPIHTHQGRGRLGEKRIS